MKKKQKIIIVLLVISMIFFIWYMKNSGSLNESDQQNIVVKENELDESIDVDLKEEEIEDNIETVIEDVQDAIDVEITKEEISEETIVEKKKLEDYELEVTDFNIGKLKEYGVPIMLDFGAAWCPPCQQMKPDVVELYNEYKDKMIILYLDIDNLENGTYGLPITVVPTQYFIDSNGNPYDISNQTSISYGNVKDSQGNIKYSYHQGMLSKDEMLSIFKELGLEI